MVVQVVLVGIVLGVWEWLGLRFVDLFKVVLVVVRVDIQIGVLKKGCVVQMMIFVEKK